MSKFLLFSFLLVFGKVAAQTALLLTDGEGTELPFGKGVLKPQNQELDTDSTGRILLPTGIPDTQRIELRYTGYSITEVTYGELSAKGFVYQMTAQLLLMEYAIPLEVIGRRDEVARDLPYQNEAISKEEIAQVQSLTTADALANLSGVYIQKSQFGGGSPVVRGFEANRVLLVVDGVRMNNAIYRNGHLQNAITIDPLALDKLEVIYGAGALAYGSDAVGGVVHFRTQQPSFAGPQDARWSFEGAMKASSAARAFGQSLKIQQHQKNFAALTLISTNFTSHLRSGAQRSSKFPVFGLRGEYLERRDGQDRTVRNSKPNVQVGTAFEQYNLLQKFRFRLHHAVELSANFQYSTTSNVPRYDALTELRDGGLRWARWDYGPQTRALAAIKLSDRRGTRFFDVANYLLSHQVIGEDRIRRRANAAQEENNQEQVNATNIQTDFALELKILKLRYGFDLRYDHVNSQAFLRNVDSGAIDETSLSTRYPSGGSSLISGGAYAEADRELGQGWQLRGGLRWNRQRLRARFSTNDPVAWPRAYLAGVGNIESSVTTALGLIRDGNEHRYRLLFAQGFRAPNIDDFAKFRERNGFILVPNTTLQPERSNTLEAGYNYVDRQHKFRAGATAYHTWLNNAIIRRDGNLPDGSQSFVSLGDTLFVQTNANAESARVYGFDIDLSLKFFRGWQLSSSFHYLRGRRDQLAPDGVILDLPQDHIPPPYGDITLGWTDRTGMPWNLRLSLRYQLSKQPDDYAVGEISGTAATGYTFDRTGTADNLEFTPLASDGQFNYTGSYGWWTANIYAEYLLNDHFTFRLKGENLLDRHYRTFASGVSAAGIDVGFGLTAKF